MELKIIDIDAFTLKSGFTVLVPALKVTNGLFSWLNEPLEGPDDYLYTKAL